MIGVCQSCGKPVRSGSHFCSFCGSPNASRAKEAKVCPSCGASAKSNAHFCSSCGCEYSLRTPHESGMKPEVNDIVSQGRPDALNERRHTVIKVVDINRVLGASEPNAGVEFFSISVHTDVENAQYITDADLLFIAVDSGDETAVRTAGALAKAARSRSGKALIFSVVLSRPGQLSDNSSKMLARLEMETDALIVVPQDSNALSPERVLKAFADASRALIQCVAKLLNSDAVIRADYEDMKALFTGAGRLFLGIGVGEGKERGITAVREALDKPITERVPAKFRKVLVYMEGDDSFSLSEMTKTVEFVAEASAEDALIAWGNTVNPDMADAVKVFVLAA